MLKRIGLSHSDLSWRAELRHPFARWVLSMRSTPEHSSSPVAIQVIQIESTRIEHATNPSQHSCMLFVLRVRQGSQKPRVAVRATDVVRGAGIFSCCAKRQAVKIPRGCADIRFDHQAMPPVITHVVEVVELAYGPRI
jgi:hypothetical protein